MTRQERKREYAREYARKNKDRRTAQKRAYRGRKALIEKATREARETGQTVDEVLVGWGAEPRRGAVRAS